MDRIKKVIIRAGRLRHCCVPLKTKQLKGKYDHQLKQNGLSVQHTPINSSTKECDWHNLHSFFLLQSSKQQ